MWCVIGFAAFFVCPYTEMTQLPTTLLEPPAFAEFELRQPPQNETARAQYHTAPDQRGTENHPFVVDVLSTEESKQKAKEESEENILAAGQFGIHAHQFKTEPALIEALKAAGVL